MIRNPDVVRRLARRVKDDQKNGVFDFFSKYFGANRSSLKLAIQTLLVALSLASAHYSGFMSHMPFELVSIVAVDFLPSFISVFVFYFILCYSIARVFAFCISQLYVSLLHALAALVLRLRKHWPLKFGKAGVRMYRDAIYYEPILYWFLCILILLFVFNIAYLRFNYSALSAYSMLLGVGAIIALVVKAGFLARSPIVVLRRLFNKDRVALRRSILKACLYFITGSALVLSFFFGYIRFDKLIGEEEVFIGVGKFSGAVNVVMNSNGSFVAVDQKTTPNTYYYLSEGVIIKFQGEIKKEAKSKDAKAVD